MGAFPSARVAVLALVLASAPPQPSFAAQGGYTTEKHPALGLTFPRARDYEQVPTQPDEPHIVLFFAEKAAPPKKGEQAPFRPEMNILWIDYVPDAPAATGDGSTRAPSAGEKKPEGDEKSAPPINSLERWVEQRLRGWTLGAPTPGKERGGYQGREYALAPPRGDKSGVVAWAYAYTRPERTIAVIGFAPQARFADHVKIWRVTAEKLDIDEPEEQSTAKLERLYARTKLKDPEFRIRVRKQLVRGWKAEDLENYIVIYDTPDQPLMRRVFTDIELLRKEYEKLFPPAAPVEAVSTVRVCKSREEYLSYGGMPGSAGFWNSSTEELVLYDAEKMTKNHGSSDADTFIVLYHEAFHQYIHYSTGELPPHSWYNEGHGDFFSGARIGGGKLRAIGVNPWRIELMQAAILADLHIPWRDIVRFEQAQYYAGDKRAICYAQGWAMVYFLRTSKDVEKRPEWARILPTYFDTLKQSYGEELARLKDAGLEGDEKARGQAGLAARTRAVDAAFQGVDFAEIEAAWKNYTLGLKVPKER